MRLISDSGSTKTDWALCENGQIVEKYQTIGLNPYHQAEETIAETVAGLAKILPVDAIDSVQFYGSGCTVEKSPIIYGVLRTIFDDANISVESDLLGAARALFGGQKGVACILGTGSNSCLYDGEQIVQNVSPLGFILGDEGSGAVLGRKLVGDVLKNQVPAEIRQRFDEKFSLSAGEIIENVYRKPFANRFLASFVPFLSENLENRYVRQLVLQSFDEFVERNLLQYPDIKLLEIGFVGSVAFHFQEILRESLDTHTLKIGKILKSPIENLV